MAAHSCRRCTFNLVLVALVLWLAGFIWFYQQIPRESDFPDTDVRTDAIVVLTGGMGRLEQGLELLRRNRADLLLISGVDDEVKPRELVAQYAIDTQNAALANARIILDYGPDNTVGNAQETARWMQKHGLRSLRLVTSSYHMPRSMLEFRQAMPGAVILPTPVFPEWNSIDKVVLVSRGSLRLILLEYHKYLFRRLYYALPQSLQWHIRHGVPRPTAEIPLDAPAAPYPDAEETRP